MADAYTGETIGGAGGENAWIPSKTNPHLNSHRASGMPNVGANSGSMPITTTNISVWCNGSRVGVIKKFDVSEDRSNERLHELGTEGVIQIVPGNTKGGKLSISRFALYNSNIFNALGLTSTGSFKADMANSYTTEDSFTTGDSEYHRPQASNYTFSNPFKTLKDQRVPIEIQTRTQMDGTMDAFYIETYLDCWISSYKKSISSDQITISEDVSVEYSDVVAGYYSSDDVGSMEY